MPGFRPPPPTASFPRPAGPPTAAQASTSQPQPGGMSGYGMPPQIPGPRMPGTILGPLLYSHRHTRLAWILLLDGKVSAEPRACGMLAAKLAGIKLATGEYPTVEIVL